MRVLERDGGLLLADAPGAHWAMALLFVGVGLVFVLGPLGLFVNADSVGWLARGTAMVMGGCGVAAGLWIARESPRSRLVYARSSGRVRITRVGTTGRTEREWAAADVAAVAIVTKRDDEGSNVFQVRLVVANGGEEPASLLWSHDGDGAVRCAERLGDALGVPVTREEPAARRRS
jgi:hypothetical protein